MFRRRQLLHISYFIFSPELLFSISSIFARKRCPRLFRFSLRRNVFSVSLYMYYYYYYKICIAHKFKRARVRGVNCSVTAHAFSEEASFSHLRFISANILFSASRCGFCDVSLLLSQNLCEEPVSVRPLVR